MKNKQPFGAWPSGLSAELLSQAGVRLGGVASRAGVTYWSEARPADAGRVVVVAKEQGGEPVDLLPAGWSARTRVHEYGGGSWWLGKAHLYFTNWDDQRLYRLSLEDAGETPVALTPEPAGKHALRYADGVETLDGKWVVCVREKHDASLPEAVNEIVAISTEHHPQSKVLVTGGDFYAAPRLSPDGKALSWIQWQHPQMPWDGTTLRVADIDENATISNARQIAGDAHTAIVAADWLSDGRLLFATDESGWWNLCAWDGGTQQCLQLTRLDDADIGAPPWVFGSVRFTELKPAGKVAVVVTRRAVDSVYELRSDGELLSIDTPFCSISGLCSGDSGALLLLGQSEIKLPSIVSVNGSGSSELRAPDPMPLASSCISTPQAIEFASGGRTAHAFFYPPASDVAVGLDDELPPLLVVGHGGPTSHTTPALKLSIQYWTSRGVAVVDVNYGGSTGYGRDYRRLLNGQWGVVDVEDCIAAANFLAEAGKVDGRRMVIRGGSAGGLTVLRALQVSRSFTAGTSLYGVSDLESLLADTHKFESRYLDGLVGRYPQDKAVYHARSPINHTEQLNCPLLVLQGDEDQVVPPNQSQAIVDAVAAKSLPHAYVLFEGEQHGFRRAENIIRAQQLELWFYGRVLGFEPHNDIDAPPEARGF